MNGSNSDKINDCRSDLLKIESFIKNDPMNSYCPYLISYAVIRACGIIESCVKNIFFDYMSNGANAETINYLEKQIIESSWNPSCGSIQKMLDIINSSWSGNFQAAVCNTKEKGDLTSLVNLRNDFAHGQQITASISNIIDYFDGGCIILNKLEGIVQ